VVRRRITFIDNCSYLEVVSTEGFTASLQERERYALELKRYLLELEGFLKRLDEMDTNPL